MEEIIRFDQVSFAYPNPQADEPAITVLDTVSLSIGRGEFVAVLGHNGSGKSTLAKHMNAVLLPGEGRVLVNGIDTVEEDRLLDIRRQVGMVFQNPDNQIVATVVEEDVAFALENLGVPPAEIRERVDRALRDVDMYEHRMRAPHQLSGGQKQRVAIAGIIAMRPDCIVLDEPTAMLDPRGRAEVMRTLQELNREYGITIVLITHFMDEAARSGRVVVMDGGKILLDDAPGVVFSHVELMERVGLDVPQATKLVFELRRSGFALPDDIIDADRCVEALCELISAGERK